MPDHFRSPQLRLGRAEKHIHDLKREIDAFVKEKPWTHVIEVDSNGLFKEHKIRLTRNLPDDFPLIVADGIYDLRSALAQAGTAAARAGGIANPTCSAFPFGATLKDVLRGAKRRSKHIP